MFQPVIRHVLFEIVIVVPRLLAPMDVEIYDSLDGQTALVTGANRGIGQEIARGLDAKGATVYAGARTPSDVTADNQRAIELDVTVDATIDATVDRLADEVGHLDVLVNNAGVPGPESPLHENELGAVDTTLAVDLRGPVALTSRTLPLLLDRPGSRVVNVSSGMGALGEGMSGGYPPYRIAKAGLNALTVYLDGEYRERGLIANSACPGWVRTSLGSPEAPKSPAEGADTPGWLARFKRAAPSGQFWRDRHPIDW